MQEHKREIEQLKHSNEVNRNDLESKLRYESFLLREAAFTGCEPG
jgi:hypothetical protein